MLSGASICYLITDLELLTPSPKNTPWKFSNEPESDFYHYIDTASDLDGLYFKLWMINIIQ